MNDKLLDLLAALRGGPAVAPARPAEEWPHPGGLTFARAHELASNPGLLTAEERAHLDRCPRCSGLLGAFERERADAGERAGLRRRAVVNGLRLVSLAVLPPVANWLIAQRLTGSYVAPLDWWQDTQRHFVWVGLFVALVLALGSPILHMLGW